MLISVHRRARKRAANLLPRLVHRLLIKGFQEGTGLLQVPRRLLQLCRRAGAGAARLVRAAGSGAAAASLAPPRGHRSNYAALRSTCSNFLGAWPT